MNKPGFFSGRVGLLDHLKHSYYYSSGGSEPEPVWDNEENTNDSDQQAWLNIGDSIIRGTSDSFNSVTQDSGPEPEYDDTCYYYAGTTGPVTEIGTSDLPEAVYGSWWPTWANSYYKLTGKKPVIINRGSGGAEFYPNGDTNNWYTSGANYGNMTTAVTNCLAALGTTKLRGITIHCGINDVRGAQTLSNIETAIHSLITRLQSDFPDVPIFISNLGSASTADADRYASVRGYISSLPGTYEGVYLTDDLSNYDADYKDPDGLHYLQEGNERIGLNYIKYLKDNELIDYNPIERTYSTESQAVFDAMPEPESLTTTEKNWMHDMIQYFVRKSYWTGINTFQIYRLSSQSNSLKDWRKSGGASIGSGVTFDSDNGLTTDGTIDGYIATSFTPSEGAATSNSIYALWLKEAIGAEGTIIGCTGSTSTNILRMRQVSGGNIEFVVNADNAGTTSAPAADNTMYAPKRTSIGQQGLVTNTVITGHNDNSIARPNTELYLSVHNNNGTIEDPYEGTYWAFFSGVGTNQNHWDIYRELRRLFHELEYDLAGL